MRGANNYCLLFVVCCLLACSQQDNKLAQYTRQGEELYLKHCSNCHQANGKGLGLVYPPVDQSDFVDKNFEKTICLIEYGTSGEMFVNGKSFNKAMPGVPTLTDLEIAEITTYLYNSWGRSNGIVEVKETAKILANCNP